MQIGGIGQTFISQWGTISKSCQDIGKLHLAIIKSLECPFITTWCNRVGSATNWKSVAAGFGHTVALKTDGTLWAWGYNSASQLGDGTTVNRSYPVQIGAATNWQSVSCFQQTVAIKSDGTLWAWGYNYYGQVGDGTTGNKSSPVQIGTATNWQSVSAGLYHTVAVKNDSTLWSWGADSSLNNKTSPAPVRIAIIAL